MTFHYEQGEKRPLETPKRMIERRDREGEKGRRRDIESEGRDKRERERYREGGRDKREREREREVKGIER